MLENKMIFSIKEEEFILALQKIYDDDNFNEHAYSDKIIVPQKCIDTFQMLGPLQVKQLIIDRKIFIDEDDLIGQISEYDEFGLGQRAQKCSQFSL